MFLESWKVIHDNMEKWDCIYLAPWFLRVYNLDKNNWR